jgi:hypothetical protein
LAQLFDFLLVVVDAKLQLANFLVFIIDLTTETSIFLLHLVDLSSKVEDIVISPLVVLLMIVPILLHHVEVTS